MLLKTAELRTAQDGWPAGTVGAIVEAFEDGALFEVVDEEGDTLAMLAVRYDALNVRGEVGAAPLTRDPA